MDDLLHRLRHDMVELSSQGDNFTHQIWLMYGQFEQVVDRFNPPSESILSRLEERHSPRLRRSVRRHARRDAHPKDAMANRPIQQQQHQQQQQPSFHHSDSESDSEPEVMPRMARGLYGSRGGSQRAVASGMNPLLETISVIGDLCDSDDAVDGPSAGLYAGSNSVDSGYKSSCPTPDLAQDASNYISGRPPVLKSRRTLPAIPVSHPAAVAVAAGQPEAIGSDQTPLDLDHLTSLRRTLLTAIERYDNRTKELDRDLVTNRRPRSISPSIDQTNGGRSRSCVASRRSCRLTKEASADQVRMLNDDTHLTPPPIPAQLGQAEQQPDQDGATRFSKMARCMLEIIEDLQRQQQHQQQQQEVPAVPSTPPLPPPPLPPLQTIICPAIPPKPSRMKLAAPAAPAVPAPATPPRVARRGRRKLPTPQPVEMDSDLTGADYHLYEEIVYDLGKSSTSLNEKLAPAARPPPLPARPSRPSQVQQQQQQQPAVATKPWLSVIKPLRRDRNNQLIRDSHWTQMSKLQLNAARSNLYTFGSGQSHASSAHQQLQSHHPCLTKVHHHHEDEYGFRATVSHMV